MQTFWRDTLLERYGPRKSRNWVAAIPSTNQDAEVLPVLPTVRPAYALYQMAMGHFAPRALALAAQLELADLLKDGPRSAPDLAAATQTHAPSLARLARFLASIGVLVELPDGKFALTALGQPLRSDAPDSVRSLVL